MLELALFVGSAGQVLVELVGGFESVGLMARMLPMGVVHFSRGNQ